MPDSTSVAQALAKQLVQAWPGNQTQVQTDWIPQDETQAYAVQDLVIASLASPIAGWKVGAKTPDGLIQAAPLPVSGVSRSPAAVKRSDFGVFVLELELAFQFGRDFVVREQGYDDAEIMDAVSHTVTTIEIVSSRYAQWPTDKTAMLADMQSHGGLVVGEAVPYDADYPFIAPSLTFTHDGRNIAPETPGNPAGDPRRVLPWLINHASKRGLDVPIGTLITCGTYTGVYLPTTSGVIVGKFQGMPAISLTIE